MLPVLQMDGGVVRAECDDFGGGGHLVSSIRC